MADTRWNVHPWVADGRVRFGIFGAPGPDWAAYVERVRSHAAAGFDSYWIGDHPTFFARDCWTDLAGLALATERIRLGVLVSCALYRPPGVLARLAADVDRLSGGRLLLGLGAGNHAGEFAQVGIPFPPKRDRLAALEETVRVVKAALDGETVSFAGAHVCVENLRISPGPVQEPRVPVVIAGGGERVTLRQVARYADASNFGPSGGAGAAYDLDDVRRKLSALRRHCADAGRPYETVLRTHAVISGFVTLAETENEARRKVEERATLHSLWRADPVVGTPEQVVEHYRRLIDAGLQYFIVTFARGDEESRDLFARRVMPEFARAAAA